MGNQQFKCPIGTTYGAAPLSCVMSCPTGYELRTVEGAQRCVSKADPDVSIHLVPQPAVNRPLDDHTAFEIDSLDHSSDLYARYSAEKTRFNEELAVANVKVDHQKAVDAAAANVLATTGTPAEAEASAAYTALTKDANAQTALYESQAQAKIDKFLSDYQFLRNQSQQQQMTLDLVNSVKDKMFTVKDDMEYSVSTFDKQISDIRNQININRATQQQATDYGKWIGVGLNFAIVLALLFMIFVIGRKATAGASFSPPSGPLGAPARPPASEHTVELLKGLTGLLSASPK